MFKEAEITLFDSLQAKLKVAVTVQTRRARQDGSLANLAYISNSGYAVINPSVYLKFIYLTGSWDTDVSLFMSYPQMFPLREVLELVRYDIEDESLFNWDPNQGYVPTREIVEHTVANIGKNGHAVSFQVGTARDDLGNSYKSVFVKLSASEYASVLTFEEFYNVYEIIRTLDLSTIQTIVAMGFLNDTSGGNTGNFNRPQPVQQQPQQGRFNRQARGGFTRGGVNQQPQQAAPARTYNDGPAQVSRPVERENPVRNVQPIQGNVQPTQGGGAGNLMKDKLKEVPVSTVNFDDEGDLSSIFDNEE